MKVGSKLLPASVSTLALPLLYVLILVIVSYFAFDTGISKIQTQKKNLKKNREIESVLSEKEQVLSDATGVITPYVNYSTLALPDYNPSLFVLSQIKEMARSENANIGDLSFSGFNTAEKGISSIKFTMDVSGERRDVIDFIRTTMLVAPIIKLDTVELNLKDERADASLLAQSYWKVLPTELGKITNPIEKLTSEEVEVLEATTQLKPPIFDDVTPSGPYVRSNPFSL